MTGIEFANYKWGAAIMTQAVTLGAGSGRRSQGLKDTAS